MTGDHPRDDYRTSSSFTQCEYPLIHQCHNMTKFQIKELKMSVTGCTMCSGMNRVYYTLHTS